MARIPFNTRSRVNPQQSTEANLLAPGRDRQAALQHAIVEMLEDRRLLSVSLISANSQGAAGNAASDEASVSSDGSFVAFSSFATNLGGSVQNGVENIYLRDTQTGTTTLVSVGLNGAAANGNSVSPKVSANGQFVTFASAASNLVSNDTNGVSNVFVRNMTTGVTTRISVTPSGANANGFSGEPVISADGTEVAFSSFADNLTSGATNGHDNVYETTLASGHTVLVSTAAGTSVAANGTSFDPSISGGGSFVTFRSTATNLENNVPVTNTGGYNVYISNVGANTISMVSVDAAGTASGNGNSISAVTSDNGQFVVFRSAASNLVGNDNNNNDDVFLRNTTNNTTTLLSVNFQHTGSAHGVSEFPSISDDGRYAAFSSTAPDLVVNDSSSKEQVYVTDLNTGTTYLISVDDTSGAPANGASYHTFESSNGQFVTFTSAATDLTTTSNNGVTQVYSATAPQGGGGTTNPGNPTPTPTTSDMTPPTAVVAASQTPPTDGSTTYQFSVDLSDNVALNTVELGPLTVTGPAGTQTAAFIGEVGSGTSAVATYQINFASGINAADNGTYAVSVPAGSIKDAQGLDLTQGQTAPVAIGTFSLTAAPANSPDLQGVFKGKLPLSVIGGTKGSATLVVSNQGTNPIVKTPVSFALYASQTPTVLPGATPIKVVTSRLSLKHGKATSIKFKFTYPGSLPSGNYYLVADLDSNNAIVETNKVNNIVPTSGTITIAPPFKALNAISVVPSATTITRGGKAVATITIQNAGNVTASGPLTINLTAPTGAGDVTGKGEAVATVVTKIHIGAGKSARLKIKYVVSPSANAESGFLSATIDPANVFNNPDQNANIATSTVGISIT